ncbi:MAG: hypothetical protein WBV94_00430 [Blastocatellia bacterium]
MMTMLFAISFESEAQTARVKEQVGDEYIVVIEGREYRAITADHARAIIAERDKAARIERELALREKQVEELKKALAAAESVGKAADDRAQLLDAKTQKQDAVIGNLQFVLTKQSELIGRRNWSDRLFDHPAMKFTLNIGWPVLRTWLASRR